MHTLQWTITFLTICGCRIPPSWTSPLKQFLYNFYTLLTWLTIHTFVSSQILDIVFNIDNRDDFSDNFSITLVVLVGSCKITVLIMRRKSILSLFDALEREPFLALNEKEEKIQHKYNNMIEWSTIGYTILVELTCMWIYVRSYFTDFGIRKLMFRAWLPYNHTRSLPYVLTYVHQVSASTLCALLNVGCDSLFSGMLIHIYCQFDIFEERLKNVELGKHHSAREYASHHGQIYKFAKMVNEEFKVIMLFQFCVSAAVVCFNLYQITHLTMVSKLIETALYTICMLVEILYYCWYSNEVQLKSLEVPGMIFRSNWATRDGETKKDLLMIMRRATEPIEFTIAHLLSLNLESFMALMKTSYSVFNILQQTRE